LPVHVTALRLSWFVLCACRTCSEKNTCVKYLC